MTNKVSLFVFAMLLSIGCSSGNPVSTKSTCDLLSATELPSANILGAYELTIDVDSATADLTPHRSSAIGESWIVSGRSYFDTQPCRDCFKIGEIGYDDGRIKIKFDIRHPFEKGNENAPPSARNRLDLDIFDLAMIVAPNPLVSINYPLLNIDIPEYVIHNPDGFTNELSDLIGSEIALPYVLVIDDSASVPPSSTFNKFEMGASTDFETKFPVTPGQTLVFDLYLTFGYGFSAVLEDRLRPKYFNPEFNRKAAWKVEVVPAHGDDEPELGNTWDNADNATEYDVTVMVYDWQQGVAASTTVPYDDEPDTSLVYSVSNVSQVICEIPGMFDNLKSMTDANSGTGAPDDPLIYTFPIANENGLVNGIYYGLVKVVDERIPAVSTDRTDFLIDTPDGIVLNHYTIPEFSTYQVFPAIIVEDISIPPTGDLIWANQAGGINDDYGRSVTTLSDDSVVLTGDFQNAATFGEDDPNETTLIAIGIRDIFIARYNSDGTLGWAKRAGGIASDYSYGITSLSDNSIVIVGYFQHIATFGQNDPNETLLVSGGDDDIFIARYHPDGTLVWAKRAWGPGSDRAHGVTTLSDDSIVVTGFFNYSTTFGEDDPNEITLNSAGSMDFFIARYNPDGSLAWAERAGGLNIVGGSAVSSLSDNSSVAHGIFWGNATFGEGANQITLTSSNEYDFFIARYNHDGSLAWAKRAGGPGTGRAQGITTLSDDSTVITGGIWGTITFGQYEPNETTLTSIGNGDIYIARYDLEGALEWSKIAGGRETNYGRDITALSDNSIIVTGEFQDSAIFGNDEPNETTLTSAGRHDTFIARYNIDGMLSWAKGIGGLGSDYGYGITALSDNSTVVTGQFERTIIFGENEQNETQLDSYGGSDMFIARYEP